jgi:hypothetical protein
MRQQTGVEEGFEAVEWQAQRVQRQIDGFIPGVVAAVAEEQTGGSETADGVTEMVANGKEFGLGGRSFFSR